MDTFGKRLRNLRQDKKMTLEQVANKLGLEGFSSYANYEYDRREPNLEMLVKLSDFYEVSLDYLIKGERNFKDISKEPLPEYYFLNASSCIDPA